MRKIMIVILSALLVMSTVSCAKRAPTSTGETTTEPAAESTLDKTKPARELFAKLTVGTSVTKLDEVLGKSYDFERPYFGRSLRQYECSDGGYIYVDMITLFLDEENVDLVVKSVSDTLPPIPMHEREVLEQITLGMKESEVIALLNDDGALVSSGQRCVEYLCTDGTALQVTYRQNVVELSLGEPTDNKA